MSKQREKPPLPTMKTNQHFMIQQPPKPTEKEYKNPTKLLNIKFTPLLKPQEQTLSLTNPVPSFSSPQELFEFLPAPQDVVRHYPGGESQRKIFTNVELSVEESEKIVELLKYIVMVKSKEKLLKHEKISEKNSCSSNANIFNHKAKHNQVQLILLREQHS